MGLYRPNCGRNLLQLMKDLDYEECLLSSRSMAARVTKSGSGGGGNGFSIEMVRVKDYTLITHFSWRSMRKFSGCDLVVADGACSDVFVADGACSDVTWLWRMGPVVM